jgi:hypothetical protein
MNDDKLFDDDLLQEIGGRMIDQIRIYEAEQGGNKRYIATDGENRLINVDGRLSNKVLTSIDPENPKEFGNVVIGGKTAEVIPQGFRLDTSPTDEGDAHEYYGPLEKHPLVKEVHVLGGDKIDEFLSKVDENYGRRTGVVSKIREEHPNLNLLESSRQEVSQYLGKLDQLDRDTSSGLYGIIEEIVETSPHQEFQEYVSRHGFEETEELTAMVVRHLGGLHSDVENTKFKDGVFTFTTPYVPEAFFQDGDVREDYGEEVDRACERLRERTSSIIPPSERAEYERITGDKLLLGAKSGGRIVPKGLRFGFYTAGVLGLNESSFFARINTETSEISKQGKGISLDLEGEIGQAIKEKRRPDQPGKVDVQVKSSYFYETQGNLGAYVRDYGNRLEHLKEICRIFRNEFARDEDPFSKVKVLIDLTGNKLQ